ncbi:MAG TPA: hypothetical protein VNQ90_20625, partial [Chthoniobacteraceae bacterium]|nr:hypothetical protein [Chthoniobacteraceae bacterium]
MNPLLPWRPARRLPAASFLASLLLLPHCVIGNPQAGQPFKPDAETLLLGQFEGDAYRATYANGWGHFAGSGAPLVEGYYGKGVDLRGRAPAAAKGQPGDYAQWAFWPKGNLRYDEGTVEFWFRTAEEGAPAPLFGDAALFFYSIQQLRPEGADPGDKQTDERPRVGMTRTQATLRLNRQQLFYKLVTVGGKVVEGRVDFRKTPGFERQLESDEWHHFAMTWADGALVFYLDGSRAAVHDITGEHGLALISAAQRPIAMSGLLLDELRISSVARYRGGFEPNWREGARPAYAFSSTVEHPEIPTRYSHPVIPAAVSREPEGELKVVEAGPLRLSFDPGRGDLARLETAAGEAATGREGLQLRFDVERAEPASVEAGQWEANPGKAGFVQRFDDRIEATHSIVSGEDDLVRWRVNLKNSSATEQRLEVRLGVPFPGATVSDYFDGSGIQDQLAFPRRRDEYIYTLPFVAASGSGKALGLGINPNINLSSLISEWVPVGPTGVIRQGTRLVLAPGESFEIEYLLVPAKGSFGSLDALDRYHAAFGDLYRQVADVPIYSYMPVAQHFKYMRLPDLARQFYIGNQWGHGPYHTKGDYMGSEKYWNNEKYKGRLDYAHGERHQQLYGSIENLRRRMLQTNKDSFDYYYTLRRSHDVPNLTAAYIVEDLYPKFDDRDDPLVAGQYYLPTGLFVNEFKTPLGKKFIEDQVALMKLVARYSPGFINDMCQISPYRFVDEIARKSPGRAFSQDRGTYLVGGFGHVDRYRKINDFTTEGYRQSMWSDFGMVSYMLSAHSSANAFEAGERFWGFSSLGEGYRANRYLLGEKPTVCLVSYGADQLGLYYRPEEFTPASLREYYRRNLRSIFLLALREAVYLDPPYLHGYQWMTQANPVLIESMVHGRKLVPGAKVEAPLWVVRGGSAWDSLWAVGNETAQPAGGTLALERRYFEGEAPVVARYYGGKVAQTVTGEGTKLETGEVSGRDFEAFKAVAAVASAGEATLSTALTGDGLGMQLVLETGAAEAISLRLNPFEVLYH